MPRISLAGKKIWGARGGRGLKTVPTTRSSTKTSSVSSLPSKCGGRSSSEFKSSEDKNTDTDKTQPLRNDTITSQEKDDTAATQSKSSEDKTSDTDKTQDATNDNTTEDDTDNIILPDLTLRPPLITVSDKTDPNDLDYDTEKYIDTSDEEKEENAGI